MTEASSYIVYNGTNHASTTPVVDGRTIKFKSSPLVLWWKQGDPGTRVRHTPISQVVLHHTAGEGNASAIHKTLQKAVRKGKKTPLSVHFTIDRDGRVVQHADLQTVCYHASICNERSIGIEIASAGYPRKRFTSMSTGRNVYSDTVRGKKHEFFEFFDEQTEAAISLCKDLCRITGVRYKLPREQDGRALRSTMGKQGAINFFGILGHLHISNQKLDPSPGLLDDVIAAQ